MSRTLQELVDAYVEENNLRFEGDPGVESLNKFFVALDDNYKPNGFRYGSSLEQFFADNSGAIEAVLEWVGKQRVQHWKDNLEAEVAPEEDEDSEEDEEHEMDDNDSPDEGM